MTREEIIREMALAHLRSEGGVQGIEAALVRLAEIGMNSEMYVAAVLWMDDRDESNVIGAFNDAIKRLAGVRVAGDRK